MEISPFSLVTAVLFAQLVPVDASIRPDPFASVSCSSPKACMLLDRAGGLFFSPDLGKTLVPRARLSKHGMVKVRFGGLLEGWGLDRNGGLWKSRSGGRRFEPLPTPGPVERSERITDMAVDMQGRLVLGTRSGAILRLDRDGGLITLYKGASAPIVGVATSASGALAAVYDLGNLVFSTTAGGPWKRSRPLAQRAMGVFLGPSDELVVAGCRGRIRVSTDGGRSFRHPRGGDPELRALSQSVCLRPIGMAPDGRAVLVGPPGMLILVDAKRAQVEFLKAPPRQTWRDASRVGRAVLLVGDRGARGLLTLSTKSSTLELQTLSKSSASLSDLQVLDRRTAARSFADGRIELSRDGATSWSRLNPAGSGPTRIAFVSSRQAFAIVGAHEVYGTGDGGQSWNRLGRWTDLSLSDLAFVDARRGWVVGHSGALLKTIDGGKNWTLDRLPTERGLNRIGFFDGRHGWVVGEKRHVFRTTDGGRSWKRLLGGLGDLCAMHIESAEAGWVAGDAGVVLRTQDGGKNWVGRPVPTSETIRALSFLDGLRGLAGGSGGLLFATKDGGRSWHRVELHTAAGVTVAACFGGRTRCLVGGEHGLFLLGDPFRRIP